MKRWPLFLIAAPAAVAVWSGWVGLGQRRAEGRLAAGTAEREARDLAGMPWRHPEYMTRRLRRRHERQLEALRAELWPDNEDVRES